MLHRPIRYSFMHPRYTYEPCP